MWTAAHGQILTLDNLMLCGCILVNHCCLCCSNTESVDHLLLLCPIAHSLWMYMLRLFGIEWVMPGSVVDLLFCWYHWLGKHSSNILGLGSRLFNVDYLDWTGSADFWGWGENCGLVIRVLPVDPLWLVSLLGLFGLFYPFGLPFIYKNRLGAAPVSFVHYRELFVFLLLIFH